MQQSEFETNNRTILRKLIVVSVLMFGFGWALVPLYRKICEVTGINVLTSRDSEVERAARNTQVDLSRTVVIEFDANKQGPWRFKPHTNHLEVHPGELVQVQYDLVNLEGRPVAGQAIPSYAPMQAAAHFNKLECFCFTQYTLEPGEKKSWPVAFVIDPKLSKDVTTITLSYTFFEVGGKVPPAPEATAAAGGPRSVTRAGS